MESALARPAAIRQQLLDGHFVLPRKLLSSAAPSPAEEEEGEEEARLLGYSCLPGRGRRRNWRSCNKCSQRIPQTAAATAVAAASQKIGHSQPKGDKKYKKSSSEEETAAAAADIKCKFRAQKLLWANYDLSDLLSNSEHLSPRSECAKRQTVISICIPGGGRNVNRHLPPIYLPPLFSFMPSSSSSCYPAASKFIQHNSCRNVASFAPSLSNSLSLYLFVLPISSWRFCRCKTCGPWGWGEGRSL